MRIIAGRWRGRVVSVAANSDIRPTPDRVRETVFNWLAPSLPGARCLDLFAGSGVLGLEAVSRGAAEVIFVEWQRVCAAALSDTVRRWGCEVCRVVRADAWQYLRGPATPRDLVFLDPPFGEVDIGELLQCLQSGWLSPGARVYIETAADAPAGLGDGWQWLRRQRAGAVSFGLAVRQP